MKRFWILIAMISFAGCAPPSERTYSDGSDLQQPAPAPPPPVQYDHPLMTLDEALEGAVCPEDARDTLVLIDVDHWGFDDQPHRGQLVIRRDLADETRAIFAELFKMRFPIQSIKPIVVYHWSDDESMEDNNTSGFNYRYVPDTERLSNHATGSAIDVNPKINPYFRNGASYPPNTDYDPKRKGAITPQIAQVFEKHGWQWGGKWRDKDWQHFDKTAHTESKGTE